MAIINGNDRSEIIDGTNRNDIINGNGGNDRIWSYYGNDVVHGGTGNDVIRSGAGNDDLWGDTGVNDLLGGGGKDVFHMGVRSNGFSDDWIGDFQYDIDKIDVRAWGVSDFNQIRELLKSDDFGSAWLNAFYNGRDHFLTIDGVPPGQLISSDFIYSNAGAQNLVGTISADTLFGSRSDDAIIGGGGNDIVQGGIGNDTLSGGVGNDKVIGGNGNDRVTGNSGRDVLIGGAGDDVFDFNLTGDSVPGSDRDVISDYHRNEDIIDLSTIDANVGVAGNQAFSWISGDAFTGAGQLRYFISGGNTIISGSVDNDDEVEFQFAIDAQFNPTAGDFIL